MTFQARFHHATLVAAPGLFAVLVAEMDFDAGNVFRQVVERAGNGSFGLLAQRFATCDVIVGVDLNSRFYLCEWAICLCSSPLIR